MAPTLAPEPWAHFSAARRASAVASAIISGLILSRSVKKYWVLYSQLRTTRTPFSGGSGTLPAHPEASRGALAVALVALAVTAAVGLRFLLRWGWDLLPLGLLGLLAIVLYTRLGRPQDAAIRNSSGDAGLDQAALDAVRDWRFEPAKRDGVPMRAWCIVPITFSLDD